MAKQPEFTAQQHCIDLKEKIASAVFSVFVCLAIVSPTLSDAKEAATKAERPSHPRKAMPLKERPSPLLIQAQSASISQLQDTGTWSGTLSQRGSPYWSGQQALDVLSQTGRAAELASYHNMSESQFEELLKSDPTARLHQSGEVFFVNPVNNLNGLTIAAASTPRETNIPLSDTFLLESKPGSTRTIFLDFDGARVTSTVWNRVYGETILQHPDYDVDGNPGTFSSEELRRIQQIWQTVSEDFAAFDVNVTTRDLGEDAVVRYTSDDNTFGTHVIITDSFTRRLGQPCNCAGFAFLNTFDQGADGKPVYVFYDTLSDGKASLVSTAASHEVGHTLGLSHDGDSQTAYYRGHGSGETGWAPIMGAGYYKRLVQWSRGEYRGASERQDDYLIMQQNSLYFDQDEYGDTPAEAFLLSEQIENGFAKFEVEGILQGPDDVEVFELSVGAGQLSIQAQPFHQSPNVDLLVKLIDSSGQVLQSRNPAGRLAANIDFNVPLSGTYFVQLEGAGEGDPNGIGYSDYGSVGHYSLAVQGQIQSKPNPDPDPDPDPEPEPEPPVSPFFGTLEYRDDQQLVGQIGRVAKLELRNSINGQVWLSTQGVLVDAQNSNASVLWDLVTEMRAETGFVVQVSFDARQTYRPFSEFVKPSEQVFQNLQMLDFGFIPTNPTSPRYDQVRLVFEQVAVTQGGDSGGSSGSAGAGAGAGAGGGGAFMILELGLFLFLVWLRYQARNAQGVGRVAM